jgi:CheY-like chemotaxis protein
VALDSASPAEAYLRFSVEDSGIGISAQDQQQIFAPFMQVDASTTRRHGGTGLGLTIASDLIRAMGGRLAVKSELGRGSTFYFTIPVSRAPQVRQTLEAHASAAAAPQGESSARREVLRILLVEDVPTNQMLIRRILEKRGHRVDVADNGREAVQRVSGTAFDVILMDVQMPVMDGYQATAAIREMPALARVPIVALTAHAMPGDRERCVAAGMDAYLTKPIDVHELVQMVEGCCRQPQASSAEP